MKINRLLGMARFRICMSPSFQQSSVLSELGKDFLPSRQEISGDAHGDALGSHRWVPVQFLWCCSVLLPQLQCLSQLATSGWSHSLAMGPLPELMMILRETKNSGICRFLPLSRSICQAVDPSVSLQISSLLLSLMPPKSRGAHHTSSLSSTSVVGPSEHLQK